MVFEKLLCPPRSLWRRAWQDGVSQHKTKTKTDFLVSDRSCAKTDGLRPHHCRVGCRYQLLTLLVSDVISVHTIPFDKTHTHTHTHTHATFLWCLQFRDIPYTLLTVLSNPASLVVATKATTVVGEWRWVVLLIYRALGWPRFGLGANCSCVLRRRCILMTSRLFDLWWHSRPCTTQGRIRVVFGCRRRAASLSTSLSMLQAWP